jgi:hypothetical protein
METALLEFALMAINLLLAKRLKDNDYNPAINYFAAGMTFAFGLSILITLTLT